MVTGADVATGAGVATTRRVVLGLGAPVEDGIVAGLAVVGRGVFPAPVVAGTGAASLVTAFVGSLALVVVVVETAGGLYGSAAVEDGKLTTGAAGAAATFSPHLRMAGPPGSLSITPETVSGTRLGTEQS